MGSKAYRTDVRMSEQQRRLLTWTDGALKALDFSKDVPFLCPHRRWGEVYDDRAYLQGIALGLRFGSFNAASVRHVALCVARVILKLASTDAENEAERAESDEALRAAIARRAQASADRAVFNVENPALPGGQG